MAAETSTEEQYRRLSPLIDSLEHLGGTLQVIRWDSAPQSFTVHLQLPDDDYREKKCLDLIEQWRA